MTAADLLTTLRRRGLTVTADGDVLVVRPLELLTEPLRAAIRLHKPEIVRELAAANDRAVEARRQSVVALLERRPERSYAFIVDEPGRIVAHIGGGAGEVVIDGAQYDSVEFMQYLDRAAEQAESPAGGGHA